MMATKTGTNTSGSGGSGGGSKLKERTSAGGRRGKKTYQGPDYSGVPF